MKDKKFFTKRMVYLNIKQTTTILS